GAQDSTESAEDCSQDDRAAEDRRPQDGTDRAEDHSTEDCGSKEDGSKVGGQEVCAIGAGSQAGDQVRSEGQKGRQAQTGGQAGGQAKAGRCCAGEPGRPNTASGDPTVAQCWQPGNADGRFARIRYAASADARCAGGTAADPDALSAIVGPGRRRLDDRRAGFSAGPSSFHVPQALEARNL
ncbi:MAG: hypothetical protein ACN4EH_05590, partial [Methyloceanibacter sp.]